MKKTSTWIAFSAIIAILSLATAPRSLAQSSGFMEDYSIFDTVGEEISAIAERSEYIDRLYVVPGGTERVATYTGVMVDQPEVFMASDTPYKGVKPDAIKILSDILRQGLVENLADGFEVVDAPGPGVLYLHWAITDLYLQKKKKSLLSYTPAGIVISGAKAAMINDIWKKVDMVEMTVEMELLDSQTQELLVAGIVREGARKDKKAGQKKRDPVTWEEVDRITQTFGERLACRMGNSKLGEAEQVDCAAIAY